MRNLKRALSLAMASVMLMGMTVTGVGASYKDVEKSNNNREAIEVLQSVGIMIGDKNGNFNPEQKVTRNEMAVVMSNLMAYNVATYKDTAPFTDVPEWAEPYVAACYTNGITSGTSAKTFSGDEPVTTAQAALMVMKALGYFQYKSDFKDEWQLATISQGNKIDLFEDVESPVREAMTRSDVARLVLNALEAGTVEAEKTNSDITVGDITISGSVVYKYITSGRDYAKSINDRLVTNNDGTHSSGSIVELGEKLYQGDLQKKNSYKAYDDFGRPANVWTYKSKEIGTYAEKAQYTYTKAISNKDLYNEIGVGVMEDKEYTWNVYYNGVSNGVIKPDKNSTDDFFKTATGTLTEVYVDTANKKVTISVIDTFLAEVVRVNKGEKTTTLSLNYLSPSTNTGSRQTSVELEDNTLVEGDKVLVTLYEDGSQFSVATIEKAQTASGKVTAVKSVYDQKKNGKYAVMDEKQYDYVGNTFAKDLADTNLEDPTLNAQTTLYLDAYGNMIAFEATERSVNYLYVQDSMKELNGVKVMAVFADGTKEAVNVDKLTKADGTTVIETSKLQQTDVPAGVYAYVKSGSTYQLKQLADANADTGVWTGTPADQKYDDGKTGDKVTAAGTYQNKYTAYNIKKGLNAIQVTYYNEVDRKTEAGSQNVVSLNNSTIFVDVVGGVIYTGYQNVPTMNDIDFFVVYNKQLNADVVYITKGADTTTSDSYFYVLDKTPLTTVKDSKNDYRYEYKVMINNEKKTVVLKGTNKDNNSNVLDSNKLYKIEKITPSGEITEVKLVSTFSTAFQTNQNIAVSKNAGTIRVEKDVNIAGATKNLVDGYTDQRIYSYDKDTTFVQVELKKNGDVNSVAVASSSIINTTDDNGSPKGFSNVYVISVNDKDSRAPKAELVYVITAHDDQFADPTVTYPTTVPQNITKIEVKNANGAVVNSGSQVKVGDKLTINVTPVNGYKPVVKVGGSEVAMTEASGVYTGTHTVTGGTNIEVSAQDMNALPADKYPVTIGTESGLNEAGAKVITMTYPKGEAKPAEDKVISAVLAKLAADGYADAKMTYTSAADIKFTAVKNGITYNFKLNHTTGVTEEKTKVTLTGTVTETQLTEALTKEDTVILDADVTVAQALTVPAGKTLTVNAGKTLTANGALTVNGDITGGGTLAVKSLPTANVDKVKCANMTVADAATVSAATELGGNVTFSNNLTVNENLTAKGNVTVNGDTTVAAGKSISTEAGKTLTLKNVTLTGATGITGAGAVTISGKVTDGDKITATGKVTLNAGTSIDKMSQSDVVLAGAVTVTDDSTPTKLAFNDGASLTLNGAGKTLTVPANAELGSITVTAGTLKLAGNATVKAGTTVTVNGALDLNTDKVLNGTGDTSKVVFGAAATTANFTHANGNFYKTGGTDKVTADTDMQNKTFEWKTDKWVATN